MAWQDRIREAAYTSPSGTRITFKYENVQKEIDKKTTGFDFPDASGTFVQDLGNTGRRYPLRVIFWGDDYDLEAAVFEAALLEQGVGKLEHPAYGTVDVVPFGKISRRDDLKTASNQALIDVTFWETIGLVYPTSQADPASEILVGVEDFNTAVSEEFERETSSSLARSKGTYQTLLDKARGGLQGIADTQRDVQKQFDNIYDSINDGLTVLISDPLTLAFQTTRLIQSPARAITNIKARLDAYKNLAGSIISGDSSVAKPGLGPTSSDQFHMNNIYASTYVTGSILSVVNNEFTTKTEALEAAEEVLTQMDDVTNWRDANFDSLGEIDTGGSYLELQESVALTAGFLVEISFSLKQERTIVLDRARTIIDLSAELYGAIDSELDFLINSNNLTGSEILELPRGREIVYYV